MSTPSSALSSPPSLDSDMDIGGSTDVNRVQSIFNEFESYPFSQDGDFKAGLPIVISAIRGQGRTAAQIDELIARAQWFYFCRMKNLNIPFEVYAQHQRRNSPLLTPRESTPTSGTITTPDAPAVRRLADANTAQTLLESSRMMGEQQQGLSFGVLCQLISEGRAGEIPVQQMSNELNESQPSTSTMSARPKPWETGGGSQQ